MTRELSVPFDIMIEYSGRREAVNVHVSDEKVSGADRPCAAASPDSATSQAGGATSQVAAACGAAEEGAATGEGWPGEGWDWWADDGYDDPDPADAGVNDRPRCQYRRAAAVAHLAAPRRQP